MSGCSCSIQGWFVDTDENRFLHPNNQTICIQWREYQSRPLRGTSLVSPGGLDGPCKTSYTMEPGSQWSLSLQWSISVSQTYEASALPKWFLQRTFVLSALTGAMGLTGIGLKAYFVLKYVATPEPPTTVYFLHSRSDAGDYHRVLPLSCNLWWVLPLCSWRHIVSHSSISGTSALVSCSVQPG